MNICAKLACYSYFETERLILRPFSYEEWQDFYFIVSNPENLTFIFPGKTNEDEAKVLMVEMFMKNPLGKWAIEDKKFHQLLGAISFEKINESSGQAELGYFIRKDFWGKGLATEAVKNISFLAFYQLGLKELSIITHLENIASQKVAEKSGFILLRQFKGSDRYTHQMREYCQYYQNLKLFNERVENDYH